LLGAPDGENIILIASNWGGKKHPSWYYNVKANPQVQLTIKGHSQAFRAQEVTGPERERCWQRAVAIYPGYELYKSRTDGRTIPVFLLTPQT
jgi:deazaflavin-dependent oxidoreductase (nitroreductase family)